MKMKVLISVLSALSAGIAAFALDINLVTAGISVADSSNSNQVYAAKELEKHLNLISGSKDNTSRVKGAKAVFVIGTPAPDMGEA